MIALRTVAQRISRRLAVSQCPVTFIVVVAAVLAALPAASPLRAEEPKPAWDLKIGLSYVATGGNTDTTSAGSELDFHRRWPLWQLHIAANALRASNAGVTTAERYHLSLRGERDLDARLALTAGWLGERDRFAGYDLRSVLNGGVSWTVPTPGRWTVGTIGALTWTRQEQTVGGSSDAFGALAQVKAEYALSDTSDVRGDVAVYNSFEDSKDWWTDGGIGVEASLNAHLALKLGYRIRYDNLPVAGFIRTDTTTAASLVVKLDSAKKY
jgi:putative salt-induced outer membrane protein YdiY